MATDNLTCSSIEEFTLSGLPNLDDFNFWFGFPLIFMYLVSVLGNSTIIYIIMVHQELHEPMYIFLSMLSVVDLVLANTAMPKMLGIFWFDSPKISFSMCLTQMFFFHFLSTLESATLVTMAVDRYVAICHPLRYSSILTYRTITKISLVLMLRGAAVMVPLPFIIQRFPLWKSNHLTHSYCVHQELMKLACADIKVNIIYGLFITLYVMGMDSLFISISYMLIIKTVVFHVTDASQKAISTCTSHICAVLIYYIPYIGLAVVHRFPSDTVPNLHILCGNAYLLLAPVINPLIYGIKTKKIRCRLSKYLSKV
ncbi:PREDICTED: olfactory receptor 51E1-like [Nanorana parkeri]|uniref:olfactory receptor 51E1-like n=1 Tax=Nanorana parkeri TaxID=125878 RepID=UPI000854DE67|nr:PREDICTED: olfactory receptor 51E1-like [Nanorana parkeri]